MKQAQLHVTVFYRTLVYPMGQWQRLKTEFALFLKTDFYFRFCRPPSTDVARFIIYAKFWADRPIRWKTRWPESETTKIGICTLLKSDSSSTFPQKHQTWNRPHFRATCTIWWKSAKNSGRNCSTTDLLADIRSTQTRNKLSRSSMSRDEQQQSLAVV